MRSASRSRSWMVGVMAATLLATPAAFAQRAIEPVITLSSKVKRGLFNGAVPPSSSSLLGISSLRISVAQGKRNAAKRRNQRRHKRHLRR